MNGPDSPHGRLTECDRVTTLDTSEDANGVYPPETITCQEARDCDPDSKITKGTANGDPGIAWNRKAGGWGGEAPHPPGVTRPTGLARGT
jgi:hypothetical protein